MNMYVRIHEIPWLWVSTSWIFMTMSRDEINIKIHDLLGIGILTWGPVWGRITHEYEWEDYEWLWTVWTKFINSMNFYEYEYETHDYE